MTLDEMIRDHLSNADHEDWCDARIHTDCCGKECNCFLAVEIPAILAVLDLHRSVVWDLEEGPEERCMPDGQPTPCSTVAAIGSALGITQETTHGD